MNQDFPLHSVSEIKKRTGQLALVSITIGLMLAVIYTMMGLNRTAILVLIFCSGIALMMYLHHKNFLANTKLPLIAFVGISLIFFAANNGYTTGQYLYFFPSIISIPIIVDNHKTYFNKVILYFSISGICFLACILVGVYHRPWEPISEANRFVIFFVNAVSAMVATIGFAYINVSLERKYLRFLIDQKNNTIDTRTQFLSTMGHELRTPLNGIIGAINLLKKTGSLPEQQEYFDILKYCSNQMLYQVNDILDFNKIEAGKLEIHPVEVNLNQLLVNAIMPFISLFDEKGLRLLLDVDPKLNRILLVDDVRIIQILNNLLSNAGKFTSAGFVKLSAAIISQNPVNTRVKISVEDTGSGIAKEDQERVFDSFGQVFDANTRQITGSGLGLTICNQILELMDSKMELQSEKGVGSTFSFSIDFKPAATPKAQPETVLINNNTTLQGIKILLVEDNQINMMIAQKMLGSLEAETVKTYNGEEALAELAENFSSYQIVLMDLEMPVMDGHTAIKQIKTRWPQLPVLAFTATMMDTQMLENLQQMGFEDAILKPFQSQVLLEQIKKHALAPAISL